MSFATSSLRAACDCCHRAKTKCSRGLPCQRCERLNASCHYSERRSECYNCRQAKTKCSLGLPCQRCERLNASCNYRRRSACYNCRRAKLKCAHGIHEPVNAGDHSSNKREDGPEKAEVKDTSPTTLGVTTSGGRLSHSMPICTSVYRTLSADDYPLYNPAMGSLGSVDVPNALEDLARVNASQTVPTLVTNSCYVPASNMPSSMLPILRLEDHSLHTTLNLSFTSWRPEEQWQYIMMPDPPSNCASTYQTPSTYDYQLYDPVVGGLKMPNVPETSLSDGPMLDMNNGYGITKDGMTGADASKVSPKLHSICDNCRREKTKCSSGQPCERCNRIRENCSYSAIICRARPQRKQKAHKNLPQTKRRKNDTTDQYVSNLLRCLNPECSELTFSTTATLLRHKREVHRAGRHTRSPCLIETCDRATYEEAFLRSWNCYDHMRRVHDYQDSYDEFKRQLSLDQC